MTSTPEASSYRVILLQPDSSLVFAIRVGGIYTLPRVGISMGCRLARQIQESFLSLWGMEIFILDFVLATDSSSGYAIAEQLHACAKTDLEAVSLNRFSEPELSSEVRVKIAAMQSQTEICPLAQIGWIHEVSCWLEAMTGFGLSPNHGIKQFNAGGPFSLVRFQAASGQVYWFKATGEPNTHEFSVTCLLSRIGRPYAPEVVATKPEWNAWLMSSEGADAGTQSPDDLLGFLVQAVRSMAELQIATIGQQDALLRAGAFDQRGDILQRNADALFEYIAEMMSLQTSTRAPQLTNRRLHELRDTLLQVCDRVSALKIPDCILHGDLNLGNILPGYVHCQFIDWCEAYIGHPLIALQHLLLLDTAETLQQKRTSDNLLIGIYASVLEAVCDPVLLADALRLMPFLAAISALHGSGRWLKTGIRDNPNRQRFARTVARHMDRAARDSEFQEALNR